MAVLSYDGGRAELVEYLQVSPFNKDLSNHGVGNLSPAMGRGINSRNLVWN